MQGKIPVATMIETELAANLPAVLDRVRAGEHIVVERDSELVATLGPSKPGITLAEFFALVQSLPRPDDQFAGDLEAVQAEQPLMKMPEWSTETTPLPRGE